MNKKKIYLSLFVIGVLSLSVFYFFFHFNTDQSINYEKLRESYPDFVDFVDDIEKKEAAFSEYATPGGAYLSVGMAWKSLADRTNDIEHYKKAMEYFDVGFFESGETKAVFLINSGNMAVHMKDYALAETYYLKALEVSPTTESVYLRLADLYYYHLKKSPEDIIAILDKAIDRIVGANNSMLLKKRILSEIE